MRKILIFLLLFSVSFAANLVGKIDTKFNILGLNLKENLLIITTDGGELVVYDMDTNTTKLDLELDNIKTFFGDDIKPRVLSGDMIGDKILMLGESDYGKKALYFYENGNIAKKELQNEGIKKALFVDENLVVLASMSNEIYLYNISQNKIISQKKFSTAALSDIEVRQGFIFIGCESGIVYVFNPKSGDTQMVPLHKDNIYDIEISSNIDIISGGVDKHAGLYVNSQRKKFPSSFLVYAVGINIDGTKAALMSSENSDVTIFDTKSLDAVDKFNTGQSILNGIKFYGKNLLLTSAYEKNVKIWEY